MEKSDAFMASRRAKEPFDLDERSSSNSEILDITIKRKAKEETVHTDNNGNAEKPA